MVDWNLHGQFWNKTVKNFGLSHYYYHIWNQHEKCIKLSPNMSSRPYWLRWFHEITPLFWRQSAPTIVLFSPVIVLCSLRLRHSRFLQGIVHWTTDQRTGIYIFGIYYFSLVPAYNCGHIQPHYVTLTTWLLVADFRLYCPVLRG